MQAGVPVIKDIVLIGGGHSHVTVLKRFGMRPVPGVQLTLISPDAHTPYSGMLPGYIAGHYTYDEAHIDLAPLSRFANARFIVAEIEQVDPVAKQVHVAGRPPIAYNVLSINAGSTPDPIAVPGAKGRVIPVKPVSEFLVAWEALKQRTLAQPDRRIGVIGAGAGGIELALSAEFAINKLLEDAAATGRPGFQVITKGDKILATHNAKVQATFLETLKQRGIALTTNFNVDRVSEAGVHAGAETIELDDILWVTGASAVPWIKESGFETDERGFLKVRPTLQAMSHVEVFAAGDIAAVVGYPRPKSGVFAVRQGPPLEANLRRVVLGQDARNFRPQSAFLSLISTGAKHAVASRGNWSVSGDWIWRWKDHIDRSFMDKFNKLPEMDTTRELPTIAPQLMTSSVADELGPLDMRCGGCGAKVASSTLAGVLARLDIETRPDIIAGVASADDAAIFNPPQGRSMVQSVDGFRAMHDDPYVFGQIAANHALGDVFAMGATPHSALAFVTVPQGLRHKNQDLLLQLLSGALKVLNTAGCPLVGGHTAEGAELALGFTVNGTVDRAEAQRKSGMQPGDAIILTKPLGTGTLFAANMHAVAKGRWLQAAVASALQSNSAAAEILSSHDVRACTDVTGFGLAGHLIEMLTASEAAAEINTGDLPAINGALDTIRSGHLSTLHRANADASANWLHNQGTGINSERRELMFDPQTAGGLLASVPEERSDICIAALTEAGYTQARRIGTVKAITSGALVELL
ncbi:MAG: selenide, water dikinase SelD [Pseudomonadota bacterium]